MSETIRIDIGCTSAGQTFVRVAHLPSGAEKIQIGLNGDTADAVAKRLTEALRQALEDDPSDHFT